MGNDPIHVQLTRDVLDSAAIQGRVEREEAGAVVVFVGTARNNHAGRSVLKLEYEAQGPLTVRTMRRLCLEAKEKYGLEAVALEHRLGSLEIGEASIVIAVSSGHRGPAFEGCRYLIDTLKRTVPIWKKEFYADGSEPVWVGPDGKPIILK